MASPAEPGPSAMQREAAQAPAVAARQFAENRAAIAALARRLLDAPPTLVATCARGSSDHAATYAKYLIETRLGVVTASLAPSVSSVYAARPRLGGALVLAISQSGESPDLLATAEAARAAGAMVVALVNAPASPLAGLADVILPLHAGPERSVAATKSCIAAFAAVLDLAAAWTGEAALAQARDALPSALEAARLADWSGAAEPLRAARDLYVLGRGLGLATAQEAALKLKETCALHAEACSAAEVRHGPMALLGERFPVLTFAQDDETAPGVYALARDLRDRGVPVLLAGSEPPGSSGGWTHLPLAPADPAIQPILALQSVYGLAASVSLARGLDPDRPPHLRKVTETL